jgi:predicted RNA polymerase sigma factor
VLSGHVPDEPEALACHALLLLHEARAAARVDAHGDLVSLEDQDRGLWDDRMVARGDELLQRACGWDGDVAVTLLRPRTPSSARRRWRPTRRCAAG